MNPVNFAFQRSYRGPIQAVIFDWAGTLVDYGSCAPVAAFIEVFRRKGIELTQAEARKPMGVDKRKHLEILFQLESITGQWKKKWGKDWNEADIDALYREFVPLQIELLPQHSRLIPGTLETVQELNKRGIRIGTTTGYNRDMIGLVAQEAAKQGFEPEAIVCVSEVPSGRPEPWMALLAAQKLRIFPLESCVKIGDTLADIEEGLNAGMWTIGVALTGNEVGLPEEELHHLPSKDFMKILKEARTRLLAAGAHFVVDRVSDILPCLDQINSALARGEKP